jgi:phage shock protein E
MSLLSHFFGGGNNAEDIRAFAAGAVLLDVRTPEEFAAGTVSGALNLPLDRIVSGELPEAGKRYVVFCRSGVRAAQALQILQGAGFEVASGGGWEELREALGL